MSEVLKLLAVEPAEIEILSAAIEGMISSRGEMKYNRSARSFEIIGSRFMWEKLTPQSEKSGPWHRTRSGFHLMDVLSIRSQIIGTDRPTDVQELLTVDVAPGIDGQAVITLKFAANRSIELAVECINASLTDFGEVWKTDLLPNHDLDESNPD